jgi:hypothetical protein
MNTFLLSQLCERGSIALVTRKEFHSVGFALGQPEESPVFEKLTSSLQGRDCLQPARE